MFAQIPRIKKEKVRGQLNEALMNNRTRKVEAVIFRCYEKKVMTDQRVTTPLLRRIYGSFLSALVGWIASMIIIGGFLLYESNGPSDFGWYFFVGVIPGVVIFGTWIVALIPLYLFVPLNSILWRWPVCAICGTIAAAIIFDVLGRITSSPQSYSPLPDWSELLACIPAAAIGGITCLFGSLTKNRFQYI
jgi:hypothetical protein